MDNTQAQADTPAGRRTILIADDDSSLRVALEKMLEKEGYRVIVTPDGRQALEALRKNTIHVLVADLKMPEMDGMNLLKTARTVHPDVEVILISGHGTIGEAVEAMKEGAYDFLIKPFKRITLIKTISRALNNQILVAENRALKSELARLSRSSYVVGQSMTMRRVYEMVDLVAQSSATVLVTGKSGTGKGVLAKAIHDSSERGSKPFIKVSCAALPETLLEAELFGYEPGAYTGATRQKLGRFELANGGTLFLDEIGEVPPSMQVKLLRVIQEGEFERLGGTKTIKSDVRLIAATNIDLEKEVQAKRFREDLFYRLKVITIDVPTLDRRSEDIPILAQHFLELYAKKNGRKIDGFAPEAIELFQSYPWPGNVRELENAIERSVVLARGDLITPGDLPDAITASERIQKSLSIEIGTPLKEIEERVISETLKYVSNDKNMAARLLGISARTLYRREETHSESHHSKVL